jgi:hypothetical protein
VSKGYAGEEGTINDESVRLSGREVIEWINFEVGRDIIKL